MDYPSLHEALSDYFGEDEEFRGPEDETYAWQEIVRERREGSYPDLLKDIDLLLTLSDEEILDFLRFSAPAWKCDDPADARRGLQTFGAYVSEYA